MELGYSLASEEHAPGDLVRHAKRAEEVGFRFAVVSDHFHPWVDAQGESPFVWAVVGAIAQATTRLRLGTGVTCPLLRMHPAIVAHAAATAASMMPGRFFLGVGTGENLNEHILGQRWPGPAERLEMLAEAIEVIRLLWAGGTRSHRGKHFVVENARLYTRPETPPQIMVAAVGKRALELAGRLGDGLVSTVPEREIVERFEGAGGEGKPRYGHLTVCWARDDAEARRTAHRAWPNGGLPGQLPQELPLPEHFGQAARLVREEDVARDVICSADPGVHRSAIQRYVDAGFDHVYVHQVGRYQDGFFTFYERDVLPHFR